MTVADLIRQLEDYDADSEVRIAFQPSWPLTGVIVNIVADGDLPTDDDADPDAEDHADVVWVAIEQPDSDVYPYAPRGAWGR